MEAEQHASEYPTNHRIKKEIKICIGTNENENTTTQNLWNTVKAVLRITPSKKSYDEPRQYIQKQRHYFVD